MKKSDAELGVRSLVHQWRSQLSQPEIEVNKLYFSDFFNWLNANYPSYLEFRSRMPVSYMVEMWFDAEHKQSWKN